MSTPGQDGRPRSGAGIDPDRLAIDRDWPPPVPGLAAGVISRRPSGARPPLPKNLRGAARFWLVMISLLVVAPFLGLGAAGGSGSYVGQINDAARKLFEPAHFPGLTALVGAVSLLGSVWTLGILRRGGRDPRQVQLCHGPASASRSVTNARSDLTHTPADMARLGKPSSSPIAVQMDRSVASVDCGDQDQAVSD
jgi:hypothetical protein